MGLNPLPHFRFCHPRPHLGTPPAHSPPNCNRASHSGQRQSLGCSKSNHARLYHISPHFDRSKAGRTKILPFISSRFHEGLLTLKSFPKVSVGFQKFWAETSGMLCSHDRFTSCLGILPPKTIIFNNLSQPTGLRYKLYHPEQSTKFQKFGRLYLVGRFIQIPMSIGAVGYDFDYDSGP